ncbi:hypothetical protein HMPREF9370_2516 [Neisseria wadsworthii 9715]|uniref:Uncharacterized protein n=1 Tax=Neisseria wadsworthii 9715 TaxID=1030841 RepID=G4CTV6_9NEIS|nr:hypothetical protein HMPREF9370_2516 [Neisseria wadsworthii 9715]
MTASLLCRRCNYNKYLSETRFQTGMVYAIIAPISATEPI